MKNQRMRPHRVLALLLALVMILTAAPWQTVRATAESAPKQTSAAYEVADTRTLEERAEDLIAMANPDAVSRSTAPKADELVRVIVELDTESLTERWEEEPAADSFQEFLTTDTAARQLEANEALEQQVLSRMEQAGIAAQPQYHYTTMLAGFAAQVPYGRIGELEELEGVARVVRCREWELDTAEVSSESVSQTLDFANRTDYQGEGVVIGIIDTGLDLDHEAFANAPANPRLDISAAQAMVCTPLEDGTYEAHSFASLWMANNRNILVTAEELYKSEKVPFAFDYADVDTDVSPTWQTAYLYGNSHGTHVAGIAAGKTVDENGTVTFAGEAPEAQLAIFKVFSDKGGGAYDDVILAAVNDALVLGVDVLNMSLGSASGFAEEEEGSALQVYYDAIASSGVLLNCSAGNDFSSSYNAPAGDFAKTENPDYGIVGSPSTYASALSVASLDATRQPVIRAGEMQVAINNVPEHDFRSELLQDAQQRQIAYVVIPGQGAAEDYQGLDVTGKVALVQRGGISFEEKQGNAADAGAAACLIYDNRNGSLINMTIDQYRIPTAAVSLTDGLALAEREEKVLTLQQSDTGMVTMSDFSSWGPAPGLELKPEITGPGGNIYSALPIDNSYGLMSGTSMSSPYLAGVSAALTQYISTVSPNLKPTSRRVLANRLAMSTAEILRDASNGDLPYSPRKQGAGLVDLEAAVKTPAYLYVRGQEMPKLELGDDPQKSGVYTLEFCLQNQTGNPLSYDIAALTQTDAVTPDGKFVNQKGYALHPETAIQVSGGTLTGNTVTVRGGGCATIRVTLALSQTDRSYMDAAFENGTYVEGFVTLTAQDLPTLSIPFLAFYGDWTAAPILDQDLYSGQEPDVLATVVRGMYNNYMLYDMGRYLFELPEGVAEPKPSKDKIALTMGYGNGVDTLYYVEAGALRAVKEVQASIVDCDTDQVYASGSGTNYRKTYYSPSYGEMIPTYLGDTFRTVLGNNSRFHFQMDTYVDAEGVQSNRNNSFAFDCYVDNEKPKLVNGDQITLYEGEDGRTYVDITLVDNHYLQCANLCAAKRVSTASYQVGDSYYELVTPCVKADGSDAMPNEPLTMTFDVTEFKDDLVDNCFFVTCYDYALNYVTYLVELGCVPVESLTMEETEVTVKTNEAYQLHAKVLPENATTQDLTWSSSNSSVVRVSENGEITGMKAGTANVTVRSAYNTRLSQVCKVTVTSEALDPHVMTSFTLSESERTLEIGKQVKLNVKSYQPYNAVNTQITLSSGNEAVVRIDNGYCVAVAPGEAVITAKAVVGDATATCVITVPEVVNGFVFQGTKLVQYNGTDTVVRVPEGTKSIGSNAFYGKTLVEEVYLPDSVQVLENSVFGGCTNLKQVHLPETMTSWGTSVFNNCKSLTAIRVPEGVTSVGDNCFKGCAALAEVQLPSTLTNIGAYAFENCSALPSLVLPTAVSELGKYLFHNCTALQTVTIQGFIDTLPLSCFYNSGITETPDLSKVRVVGDSCFLNCKNLKEAYVPANVEKLSYNAFSGCTALTTATVLGETELGTHVFNGCKALTSFTGNNLPQINSQCFAGCTSLVSFRIPEATSYIGDNAFKGCTMLSELIFPANSQIKGPMAFGQTPFANCSKLDGFTVEEGNTYLSVDPATHGLYGDNGTICMVFPYKNYGTTLLPTTKIVGRYAFLSRTALTSIELPEGLEEIYPNAFSAGKLTSITLPSSLKKLHEYAFSSCTNLTTLNLNQGLEYIGMGAFSRCTQLTELTIPSSVKYIGKSAFSSCNALETLKLNEGLETIGESAFENCQKLTQIILPSTVQELGERSFYNCRKAEKIDCGNVTVIPRQCFNNCQVLTELKLSDQVTVIGESAFSNCSVLAEMPGWPSQLREIGKYAFSSCKLLKNLDLSGTQLVTLGDGAFGSAYAVEKLALPDTLETIGTWVFRDLNKDYEQYGCKAPITELYLGSRVWEMDTYSLKDMPHLVNIFVDAANPYLVSVGGVLLVKGTGDLLTWPMQNKTEEFRFPDTITQLPMFMLQNNQYLKKVTIPGSVTLVNYGAFQNCVLEEVIFEDANSTILIDSNAFENCANLKSVRLPEGLVGIGNSAFENCASLESITMPDSVYSLGNYTFMNCASLKECKLSKKLSYLSSAMFLGCSSLEELNLPAGIRTLGTLETADAFENTNSLKAVHVDPNNRYLKSVDGVVFDGNGKTLRLYPMAKTETTYTIPEGVTRIGSYAFAQNPSLVRVTLPSTLERVGCYAFNACENLKTYVFHGQTAPQLESLEMYNRENFYANFTGHYRYFDYSLYEVVTQDLGLTMFRPAQATGYDTDVWMGFFGTENGNIFLMEPELFTAPNLQAKETETGAIQVSWDPAVQAQAEDVTYTLERAVATQSGEAWEYGEFIPLAQKTTERTYTDNDFAYGVTYAYRVTTYNAKGETGPAAVCRIMVTGEFRILSQPASFQGQWNETAVFTLRTNRTNASYQWQFSTNGGKTWTDCSQLGSKTNTMQVQLLAYRNGNLYRCVATDETGTVLVSEPASLTKTPSTIQIQKQPVNIQAWEDDMVQFTVEATGEGLTYQWQYSNNGGASWGDSTAEGANTATITTQLKAYRSGQCFRCKLTDVNGDVVYTDVAVMSLRDGGITIIRQPKSVSVASGEQAIVSVEATGENLTYQWQYSNDGGKFWSDSHQPGSDTSAMTVQMFAYRDGQCYRCIIRNEGGFVISDTATLTLEK